MLALLSATAVWSSPTDLVCQKSTDYKIVNSSTLLVRCEKDYSRRPSLDLKLFLVWDTTISEQDIDITATLFTGTTDWMVVTLPPHPPAPMFTLHPGNRYPLP